MIEFRSWSYMPAVHAVQDAAAEGAKNPGWQSLHALPSSLYVPSSQFRQFMDRERSHSLHASIPRFNSNGGCCPVEQEPHFTDPGLRE